MAVFYMLLGITAISLIVGLQRNGIIVYLKSEHRTETWKFYEFGTLTLRIGMGLFFMMLVYSQLPKVETWEEFSSWVESTGQDPEGAFKLTYLGVQFTLGLLLIIGTLGKGMRQFISLVWLVMVLAQGFGEWPYKIGSVTLLAFDITLSPEQLFALVSIVTASSYFISSFKKYKEIKITRNPK